MKKLIKEFIDAGYPILFEKEQGMYKCTVGDNQWTLVTEDYEELEGYIISTLIEDAL